jgi:hypothetical protein
MKLNEGSGYARIALLVVTASLGLWPSSGDAECGGDVCIDLDGPPTHRVFKIPPSQRLEFIVILPESPERPVPVQVTLYRIKKNQQVERVGKWSYDIKKEEREIQESFTGIAARKSGTFVLAVAIASVDRDSLESSRQPDLNDWPEESRTLDFEIKWKEEDPP